MVGSVPDKLIIRYKINIVSDYFSFAVIFTQFINKIGVVPVFLSDSQQFIIFYYISIAIECLKLADMIGNLNVIADLS